MIDLSDGLAADLYHLLDESHVGATLLTDAIPISEDARRMTDGRSPLDHALSDGEDFELLFTVSPDDGLRLMSAAEAGAAIHIGTIDVELGCRIQRPNGDIEQLARGGWEHRF